jgi:adenylate kinase
MGRRLCVNDNNHPNNIFIQAIAPADGVCRVCGGELKTRPDDQDEAAINKRHDIYYDDVTGTLASAHYFRDLAGSDDGLKYIVVDGGPGVKEVTAELMSKL